MKIAIPEHQGRIAPVFDTCRRILVFARKNDRDVMIDQQDWSTASQQGRVARLTELGVDVLLCGAISCGMEDQVHERGVQVIAWLAGEVPAILRAFRDGTVMEPAYAMPGTLLCRGRRQMRRRRHGKHETAGLKAKEKTKCQG